MSETSQATQQLIDDEVRRLIDSAHRDVTDLLTTHRAQLDSLTVASSTPRRSTGLTPTAQPACRCTPTLLSVARSPRGGRTNSSRGWTAVSNGGSVALKRRQWRNEGNQGGSRTSW
jgi:hypothetical protein